MNDKAQTPEVRVAVFLDKESVTRVVADRPGVEVTVFAEDEEHVSETSFTAEDGCDYDVIRFMAENRPEIIERWCDNPEAEAALALAGAHPEDEDASIIDDDETGKDDSCE